MLISEYKTMVIRLYVFAFLMLCCTLPTNAQDSILRRPKIGLVLSGGGAKGFAHIGVLKVLEELGIPIDFIGGTSMGSIVGGLYAIGYSAKQLDSITRNTEWDELLTDRIARRNLSLIEKDEYVKFIVKFPIKEKRIALPSGMVAGENISRLFSRLCSSVAGDTDFTKFKIPFLCIATNIEKGEAVILTHGSLPQAMRASMAIPTIFTPEKINDEILLDGGLTNNFPAEEVKNMGADILIGVDVGYQSQKDIELNSMVKIMEQSIFMHSRERTMNNKALCKYLIVPDLKEFHATSFNRAELLLDRGEKAARSQYEQLKELAVYLKSFNEPVEPHILQPIPEFKIQNIEINGLKNVSEDFLYRKMQFEAPCIVKIADIDAFVELMFGTWFFQRITYDLVKEPDGYKLVFNVIEKKSNIFGVGLHFDSDLRSTLLLNTTFRNLLFSGSKISLDIAVGENPYFKALIYKNTSWNPKNYFLRRSKFMPDYGLQFQGHRLDVFEYNNSKAIASYHFSDLTTDLYMQSNISKNNCLGLGLLTDFNSLSGNIGENNNYAGDALYVNFRAFYTNDSYNEAFFPTRGTKVYAEIKYVQRLSVDAEKQISFFTASFRSNFIIPLSDNLSLNQTNTFGTTLGDSIPLSYRYYLGGEVNNNLRGIIPFTGLHFMQAPCLHTWVEGLNLQWEMWKDNLLTFKFTAGKAVSSRPDLLNTSNIYYGLGLSFGYRSPIGPIELTLMTSNRNNLSGFINIGYGF